MSSINDRIPDKQKWSTETHHLMQPGAPTFSGKDTVRGTQDELYEAMKHYLAYCGGYDWAEPNGEIKAKHNLQVVSPFPNWHGREKGRLVPFNGNNLKLNTAGAYLVDVSSISVSL